MKSPLRATFRIVGMTLMAISITMVPSFIVSLICKEWHIAIMFIVLAACVFLVGGGLYTMCRCSTDMAESVRIADGLQIVILCWIVASIVGSLPYLLSNAVQGPVDAFFESCSGFTTTGATGLTDVNHLPRGLLFWRSMTCWTGGIGILLFGIALMPALGLNGQRLTSAESRGPILEALSQKMIATVRIIVMIYLSMTLVETILLSLGGMTIFNGLLHSMSTVSTGGFSRYDSSIGHFDSNYIRNVILIFMIASGMSFDVYVRTAREGLRSFKNTFMSNTELKLYALLILVGSAVIFAFLLEGNSYKTVGETASISLFQTVSVLTTTGFTTTDYHLWPVVCQMILLILMFTGACSSSPGGGLKIIRVAIILKLIRHGIAMRLHPNFMESIRLNKRSLPGDKVSGAATMPFLFFTAMFAGVFLLTLVGNPMPESFSAALSCITNTGAGFGGMGSGAIYTSFSAPSKLILSALMIGGRMELYAVMVLIIPKYWTKDY